MKGGGVRHLLPLWSPASCSLGSHLGGTRSHPQPRATIKAHPSTSHRPRPYGTPDLLPDFPTEMPMGRPLRSPSSRASEFTRFTVKACRAVIVKLLAVVRKNVSFALRHF